MSSHEVARLCLDAAAVCGGLWLLRFLYRHVLLLYSDLRAFVLPRLGLYKVDVTKHGSWAIVTGASDGIGRGYAIELARRGLNVALLSRSKAKLDVVANLIRDSYGRETRVVPVDFTQGQEVYSAIQAEISDLDVAVLVNNVGVHQSPPDYFWAVSEQMHRNIIEVNCQTMVQMTHLVIPKMVEKRKGIIINLSSSTSLGPTPLFTVYSATKSFVSFFTSGLRYEFRDKGVIVQCVRPGMVATALSSVSRGRWYAPDPVTFARGALGTLGYQQDTFGYWSHALQGYLVSSLPEWLYMRVAFGNLAARRNQSRRTQ